MGRDRGDSKKPAHLKQAGPSRPPLRPCGIGPPSTANKDPLAGPGGTPTTPIKDLTEYEIVSLRRAVEAAKDRG